MNSDFPRKNIVNFFSKLEFYYNLLPVRVDLLLRHLVVKCRYCNIRQGIKFNSFMEKYNKFTQIVQT